MRRLEVWLRRKALKFGLAATHGPRIILTDGRGGVKVSQWREEHADPIAARREELIQ